MKQATVFAIAVLLGTASAVVFYVHPESTQNCIQDCLNACSTGDTVLVGAGTYHENISWPGVPSIRLVSEHGRDTTVIDGGDSGRVITISASVDTTTVIRGFTIRNGYVVSGCGAGVLCENSAAPLVEDNRFADNCNEDPNYTVGVGGGLGCFDAAPVVRFNEFTGNRAAGGGGIGLKSSDARVYGNDIIGNCADSVGGGINCVGGHAAIDSNRFVGNTATWAAGLNCVLGASPSVTRNHFENDTAGISGGGIGIAWNSSPEVKWNTLESNVAGWYGGGLSCESYSRPTLLRNRVADNYAPWGGGITCLNYAWPEAESCDITGNRQYGIYCRDDHAGITIHHSDIVGNRGCGVMSENADTVVGADSCWWGHKTGPFHPTLNSGGLGDTVSDYVLFDPWDALPNVGVAEPRTPPAPASRLATSFVRSVIDLAPGHVAVLLDISGRTAADLVPGANDIRHLSPGVYFLREEAQRPRVQKVIVQR